MSSITIDLQSDRELRLTAAFLNAIADEREARVTVDHAVSEVPVKIVQPETGAEPIRSTDAAADAQVAGKFVVYNSAGEPAWALDSADDYAAQLDKIFTAAPSLESLDNMFAVNAGEMKKLPKALLDRVTLTYGAKSAAFRGALPEPVTPPGADDAKPEKPKRQSKKDKKPVDFMAEIGADTPKQTAATAEVAAGSTPSPGSAAADAAQSTPQTAATPSAVPADATELRKQVADLMMHLIKEVGYAGGIAFMNKFGTGVKRFSDIDPSHHAGIFATLSDATKRAALVKELLPEPEAKK